MKHGRAKLTEEDVVAIHCMYKDGMKQTSIARHYEISQAQVQRILVGKRWADVYCALNPDSV